jgi:hypothetical protein
MDFAERLGHEMDAMPIPGAEVYYDEHFLSPEEATQSFDALFSKCAWERCIATLVELHCQWNQLCMDYETLWNRWYDGNAGEGLRELGKRARQAS